MTRAELAALREIEDMLTSYPNMAKQRLRELRLSVETDDLPDTFEPVGEEHHA